MVTQLYSPSNVCVCECVCVCGGGGGVDTCCVHTQSSVSIFTMLGTAILSSLHLTPFWPHLSSPHQGMDKHTSWHNVQ